LKPFNLEEALAGKPVVTRNGRLVAEVIKFKENVKFPVIAIIDSYITCQYTSEGHLYTGTEDDLDLLMVGQDNSAGWISIFDGINGPLLGPVFKTEIDALKYSAKCKTFYCIATVEIFTGEDSE